MGKHFTVPSSVLAVLAIGALPYGFGMFADGPTDATIEAHRDRQQALMESSQAILARAESESRDLTNQEQTEIEGLTNEFDDLVDSEPNAGQQGHGWVRIIYTPYSQPSYLCG